MTAIDHALLERLARKAWADSPNPRKAKTWESAHQAVWRAKVMNVCALSQSGGIGKTLVSAIWGAMTTQTEVQPWQEMLTEDQRRFFNAICGDLGAQVIWHGGMRLDKDDYRHMISGTVLGFRTMPGIDLGDGKRGWIMLGGSSLKLRKSQCAEAITIGLLIGDHPEEQGLKCRRVRWCDAVLLGLGLNPNDFREAA